MIQRRAYIYTNKKHTVKGVMSTVFGLLALITFLISIYRSFLLKGADVRRYGVSSLLATIFMIVGFVLFVLSLFETEKFHFFKVTAGIVNVLAFLCLSAILYAGAIVY